MFLSFRGFWNSNLAKRKDTFPFSLYLGLTSLKGNANSSDRAPLSFQGRTNHRFSLSQEEHMEKSAHTQSIVQN